MNILLVSKLFVPDTAIGAKRPYQFAKYLSELGHCVHCIIGKKVDESWNLWKNLKISQCPNGIVGNWLITRERNVPLLHKPANRKINGRKNMRSIYRFAGQFIYLYDEYYWYFAARKKCAKIVKENSIDYIITSYGPLSNVLIGMYIKRRFPEIRWISDLRDLMDSETLCSYRRKLGNNIQIKMAQKADAIVVVSSAMKDALLDRVSGFDLNNTVSVIENGFENETIINQPYRDDVLRIAYTGTLYNGKSDMRVLFKAIAELNKEKDDTCKIEIHYAGTQYNVLYCQANEYDMENSIVNHGLISQAQALRLQERCDILCVLSWNTYNDQGVLTGKFPEYLRLNKPILAIISGDLPNAELSSRIADMEVGFSFEYVQEEHYKMLKDWLWSKYLEKKENGMVMQSSKVEKVNGFNYYNLTKRLESILIKI